jgi:hypothetical protein
MELKKWKLVQKAFDGKTRYLLQILRLDRPSGPYYLTQRIYKIRYQAVQALVRAKKTGKPDDQWREGTPKRKVL